MRYFTEINCNDDIDDLNRIKSKLSLYTIELINENLAKKISNINFYEELRNYNNAIIKSCSDQNIEDDELNNDVNFYDYINIDIRGQKYAGIEVSKLKWLVQARKEPGLDLHDIDDDCINYFIKMTIETKVNLTKQELTELTKIIRKLSEDSYLELIEKEN